MEIMQTASVKCKEMMILPGIEHAEVYDGPAFDCAVGLILLRR